MIKIEKYGKKKNSSTTTTSSSGGYANAGATTVITGNGQVEGINIWGQYHDHTGDVDGNMMVNGNITSSGDVTVDGDVNCGELIATEVGADAVSANRVHSGSTTTNTLNVNSTATIAGELNGDNATFTGDVAIAGDLDTANVYNEGDIYTKNLTVTGSAKFNELIIDKIKSVGGQVILSAANAKIESVYTASGYYNLYWRVSNGTDASDNNFMVNDQIICQSFNQIDKTNYNVANRYYWALVTAKGKTTRNIDGERVTCHYIRISRTDFDGSTVPSVGDEIVQLGYRGTDDDDRQSAIIISACISPDTNVTAPSIVQYKGINSFSLEGCIVNKIAADETYLTGQFRVITGQTTTDVTDLISGQRPQVITDSEQAWIMADSSSKTYYSTDYQSLPTSISVYLGNDVIPYSEWISGSTIKYNSRTINLVGNTLIPTVNVGQRITSITKNTNDVTLNWLYSPNETQHYDTSTQETITINNGTTESNKTLEITVKFTHDGTTYTATKNVPFNVIKASEVTQGADAEMDKLMVDAFDLTVNADNELEGNVSARVVHIKGNAITQVTDLSNFSATLTLSNNDIVTLDEDTYYHYTGTISSAYTSMTNPPTSATLKLYRSGTLMDEVTQAIKMSAASVFSVTDDAISAVSSNIHLWVYDELLNKTGIDIEQGKITLNGNTVVNGNLSLTNDGQGFSLIGDGGMTQIVPQSIGTYDSFRSKASTTIQKENQTWGAEKNETEVVIDYTFTTDFTVGTIKSGNTISIAPVSRSYYTFEGTAISSDAYTETSKTITFFEDGQLKQTVNWSTSAVSYTSQGGLITIRCHDAVTIMRNAVYISDKLVNSPYQVIRINVTLPNDAFMLIGYDGLAVNFGTSATAYIGAESTTVKYGNYGLQVSANGLKKWNGSTWVGINNKRVKTISANYTLTNDDDLIVFNSSTTRTLALPSTLEVGKTVYIKKLGSANLTLSSASSNIYVQNSTSSTSSATVSTYVFLIWDGSHWLLGYVG